jgi:hypothetical protein
VAGWLVSFPVAIGEFWIFISAALWTCCGAVGTLFELLAWFIEPFDESEDREHRHIVRWMFLWLSPLGGVAVVLGIYSAICVGIPYGIARHIIRSFQAAKPSMAC